ncbi:MAG TPA: prolyl oligopeptidase family serine peptidase [Chitinophagaceae bacterium]|nr:prolyl oligopeptidase family serine peptidase [Chitinophagaceae bacterium]
MKKVLIPISFLFMYGSVHAQKKPLDHSVYDGWQRIGERMISPDGAWVVYTIDPQEGDNELIIKSSTGEYKRSVPRGYNAVITEDSRYVVFKIKPFYKDTRDARIKKKKTDEFPKDSMGIIELGKEGTWKLARVKSYKTPQKGAGWVAYQSEKPVETSSGSRAKTPDPQVNNKKIDSLTRIVDSLENYIRSIPVNEEEGKKGKKKKNKDDGEEGEEDADDDETSSGPIDAGTDLIVRQLSTGTEKTFRNVLEYYFSKPGNKLLLELARNPKDSLSKAAIIYYDLASAHADTLSRGGNDFKNFAMDDEGLQVAFVAERDGKPKDLQKFYRLWYYKAGMDSANMLVDRFSVGMQLGMSISEFGNLGFSKSGQRLFFGTEPVRPPRDTSIIEIDLPKVDIWHYNDDYLQTVQTFPNRLRNDLQQNFLAVYDLKDRAVKQLGSREIPQVIQTNEGDGDTFIGVTDFGKRIESQWLGNTKKDIYSIDVKSGDKKLVKQDLYGQAYPSPNGKYILWYDRNAKNYFAWDGSQARNISQKIKVLLYDEEWDSPDLPTNYGVMGWQEGDSAVYVYDRYGTWKIGVDEKNQVTEIFNTARKSKNIFRYVQLDPEKRYFRSGDQLLFRNLNDNNKDLGLAIVELDSKRNTEIKLDGNNYSIGQIGQAKSMYGTPSDLILTKENFRQPPDLYFFETRPAYEVTHRTFPDFYLATEIKLSAINPQQKDYSWGSNELVYWKSFNGKDAKGVLYKPESFNPRKKYPMICYFYEDLDNSLNNYIPPAPIRSAINISFFVSRGYLIFVPSIDYTVGHPGKSAYNYIVSGVASLIKKGFVDKDNIAIQGHSWGGYQVAQLVTMTNMFKAAWAGAPVANMTSAYGGIRWESGVSRQFQYEKTQSRIGGTLWEKLPLYLENSPLFHLDKVKTPMVIMSNDADGAVPWYQGIELFTAMRRLGKKVWMFNYNGQGHGLTQRQDMRDYAIRMQQFFDWILKGAAPTKWITEGVPAVRKGKDWGLDR